MRELGRSAGIRQHDIEAARIERGGKFLRSVGYLQLMLALPDRGLELLVRGQASRVRTGRSIEQDIRRVREVHVMWPMRQPQELVAACAGGKGREQQSDCDAQWKPFFHAILRQRSTGDIRWPGGSCP